MHAVIEVEGGGVADVALAFAEEDFLAEHLLLGGFAGIELAEGVELGGRGEVDHVLHLGHHGDLVGTVGQVHALLGGDDVVAVEVGGALLEFGKVLDGAQGALGAVDLLVEHAAEADGVEAEPGGLGPGVGVEVEGRVGMEVRVAVEAGDAEAGLGDLAVLGLVELLLGEGGEQQAQAFHLHGGEDALEDLVVVLDAEHLALGDVAEVGARREEDGRRKLGGEAGGQVELDVKAV